VANFFLDNRDIRYLLDHMDLAELARIQELDAQNGDADYVPTDEADTVDNYRRVLEIVGQVAGEVIAPNAEEVDAEGNTLDHDAGRVTYHPLVQKNLDAMAQADLMGFTLPRRFGGLNCPNLVYTMATEIVSRADASFMNMFGLQGIAETVNAFACEEIKCEVLPRFSSGEVTGAMVLTEPDAGSDLQAVRLRAEQNGDGWVLNGVKRFITNGCGEILLTLARSEPEIADGRGLSLFISERDETVRVRHLETKLGIHGSPTCELTYDNTPAKLVGERQRGLITYVLALMNGARVGIAAQSVGIAEAAYRLARTYAHTRQQFGVPIEKMPAVAEMVTDMQIAIEAGRALLYETSRVCDLENNNLRILEGGARELDAAEKKERKQASRGYKRLNSMLTPMSKYYCSEMCIDVANDAIQVLGGSGYIKDYAAERYLRDSRITTIYEGTSQLQVVAAIRGVTSGAFEQYVGELEKKEYDAPALAELKQKLADAKQTILEAIQFVKTQSNSYVDLHARRLVDSAIAVIVGHYLLGQATGCDRKKVVAGRFINSRLHEINKDCEIVHAGDVTPLNEYELLAGPVPSSD
jgi:alkylation response protein AidB-like acyl-CoA dehydrogenase